MSQLGSTHFTYLFLNELNLKSCLGCFICIGKGENLCPLNDDKTKVEKLIDANDGLIFSSPGYVQNVSALMKNFIDRFAFTHHRPRYFGKKVLVVANGGAGLNKTLEVLSIAIGGPQVIGKLSIVAPPWPIKEKIQSKNQKSIRDASVKFYSALQNKKMPRPTFNNLMQFKFFKSASKECKAWLPADYAYYKDLQGYYYETKVNPIKNGFASVMFRIVLFLMRDMGPEIISRDAENIRQTQQK